MLDYVIIFLLVVMILLLILKKNNNQDILDSFNANKKEQNELLSLTRQEINSNLANQFRSLAKSSSDDAFNIMKMQDSKMAQLNDQILIRQKEQSAILNSLLENVNNQLNSAHLQNEQKLENIRKTLEDRLFNIQQDNNKKLDEMRLIVDEKMTKTIESRLSESFKLVSERLEQVYKGLGEMQTLANGVGDLKKVLSNVKTRGVLGEIQLEAILDQILTNDQYVKNFNPKKDNQSFVEFAIKLPGDDQGPVYLPIDAKFSQDAYSNLLNAYDSGDVKAISECKNILHNRIKGFAKDIRDKYINPPYTTDFAVLFVPIEGLYAEIVRSSLIESLQKDYKVVVAGPTTMAALLNSLQMGFRTLAIQKRSAEVWQVLSAVKTEFEKFEEVLTKTQDTLEKANLELDKLVGVRTRKIRSKLKNISTLEVEEASKILLEGDE